MKEVPDRTGRFVKRPHFEIAELDRDCESIVTGYLRNKYGAVQFPITTDDLTILHEGEVDDLDLYADLSEFGETVEGVTIFSRHGKPSVRIAGILADDASRENRLRTTLTHEFGHVRFHAYLWNSAIMELDFGSSGKAKPPSDNRQICKRETLVDAPMVDWMEWQAGHVCGAILMPASRVRKMISEAFKDEIAASVCTPLTVAGKKAIQMVKENFLVSQDAARVRLLRLGLLQAPSATPSLF